MKKKTIKAELILNHCFYPPKWWDYQKPNKLQKFEAVVKAQQNTKGNDGKETNQNDLINQSLNTGDRKSLICEFKKLKRRSEYSLLNELRLADFLSNNKMTEADFLLALSINHKLSNFIGDTVNSYCNDYYIEDYYMAHDVYIEHISQKGGFAKASVKTINGVKLLIGSKDQMFIKINLEIEVTGELQKNVFDSLNKGIARHNARITQQYNPTMQTT